MDLKIPLPKFLTLLTTHDVPIQKAMALSAKMFGHKCFPDNSCVIMLFQVQGIQHPCKDRSAQGLESYRTRH